MPPVVHLPSRWSVMARALLVGGLIAFPALAQDGARYTAQAREALRRGDEAFDARHYADAAAQYQRALRFKRSYSIACKLGRTEAILKRYQPAAQHLDDCLTHFTDSSTFEQRELEPRFRQLFLKVQDRVAKVTLRVTPPAATVTVDGQEVGRAGDVKRIYLGEGDHTVRLSLPGHTAAERRLTARPGTRRELVVTLEREREPRGAEAPPSVGPEAPGRWVGWTAGIGGGVTMAVGGVLLAVAVDRNGEKNDLGAELGCGGPGPVAAGCSRVDDLRTEADALLTAGVFTLVGGAAMVIGGVSYELWANRGSEAAVVMGPGTLTFEGRF